MRSGFTLLELSIVLVISGLIIGGITAGQELIRSAELNRITSDVNKYKVAVNTFKLKYNALPGDIDNAIAYWGAAHATPATCLVTASTTNATCNGNGDGVINLAVGSYEYYRAWQHLSNADLVNGAFNGISFAGSSPEASINGGLFALFTTTSSSFLDSFVSYSGKNSLALVLGGKTEDPHNDSISNLLAPDAKSIDDKIDDGLAESGFVYTASCIVDGADAESFGGDCLTGDDCSYDLTSTSGCQMIFTQ